MLTFFTRPPDIKIGSPRNPDYLDRWYIIPRNKWFNVYLHRFRDSDDDRALHDHPWWSISFMLKGKLSEVVETRRFHVGIPSYMISGRYVRKIHRYWPYFRPADHMHRMILPDDTKESWTLFITGPRTRMWGFRWPGQDWTPHWEFTEKYNGNR